MTLHFAIFGAISVFHCYRYNYFLIQKKRLPLFAQFHMQFQLPARFELMLAENQHVPILFHRYPFLSFSLSLARTTFDLLCSLPVRTFLSNPFQTNFDRRLWQSSRFGSAIRCLLVKHTTATGCHQRPAPTLYSSLRLAHQHELAPISLCHLFSSIDLTFVFVRPSTLLFLHLSHLPLRPLSPDRKCASNPFSFFLARQGLTRMLKWPADTTVTITYHLNCTFATLEMRTITLRTSSSLAFRTSITVSSISSSSSSLTAHTHTHTIHAFLPRTPHTRSQFLCTRTFKRRFPIDSPHSTAFDKLRLDTG